MTSPLAVTISRALYALAIIAFGVQHFLFGDFIAGRAPVWPAGVPGQLLVAYLSGALLIATGIAVLINKQARLALFLSGATILIWAALRNIYGIAMNPEYGGLLTSTFKALTLGSGAFIVANTFESENYSSRVDTLIHRLAPLGKYMIGLFLLIAGVQHFLFAEFVKFLVPTWIPGASFWTYFSAIALIAAGLGLLTGIKVALAARLAAWMVFAWVFLLHLPRAISNANQNEWTAFFEATAVSGLLYLIYVKESEGHASESQKIHVRSKALQN
jgi:uncharacterized membrane protein